MLVTTLVGATVALSGACHNRSDHPRPSGWQAEAPGFNAATRDVVRPSGKKGGTLRLVRHNDLDSLDPAVAYAPWAWNFQKGYYVRTLLTNRPALGPAGVELVPDLAADLPQITDGRRTYTFTLKAGIKFEDGTPITAKDVKYGIERIFAQDVLPGGPTYLIDALDQGQGYPGPYKDTDPGRMGLRSVQVPNNTTIVFRLKSPLRDFDQLLAMPDAGPVPAARDTGEHYADRPVSSGPYKFEFADATKTVLVRNQAWDPATDPVRKALPDQIELSTESDSGEIDDRLLSGADDLDAFQEGVQDGTARKILADPAKQQNADDPIDGWIRFFAISTKVAPFDNIHCRRAVQYAADKATMQAARGGAQVGGDIATSMLPPNIPGYDPRLDPYDTASGRAQVDKAREELRLCGQPDGFTTVIATLSKIKDVKTASALQQALAEVGIQARLDPIDLALYFSSAIGEPSSVHAKGYGIMIVGWQADFPTAYGYLSPLVDGRTIAQSSNLNYAELNDTEVNTLIDAAKAEPDPKQAAGIWSNINKIVMDKAVMLPAVYDRALDYRNPRLTNVYVSDYYGMIDFGSLGIE